MAGTPPASRYGKSALRHFGGRGEAPIYLLRIRERMKARHLKDTCTTRKIEDPLLAAPGRAVDRWLVAVDDDVVGVRFRPDVTELNSGGGRSTFHRSQHPRRAPPERSRSRASRISRLLNDADDDCVPGAVQTRRIGISNATSLCWRCANERGRKERQSRLWNVHGLNVASHSFRIMNNSDSSNVELSAAS